MSRKDTDIEKNIYIIVCSGQKEDCPAYKLSNDDILLNFGSRIDAVWSYFILEQHHQLHWKVFVLKCAGNVFRNRQNDNST